jgi:hypothetical protein
MSGEKVQGRYDIKMGREREGEGEREGEREGEGEREAKRPTRDNNVCIDA